MPGKINSYQKIKWCALAAVLAVSVVGPIGAGLSSLGIGGIAHAGMMGWVDGLSGTGQHGFFGGENRPCGMPDFPKIVPCDPGKSSAGANSFFVPLAMAASSMSACITIEIQMPVKGDQFVFDPNGQLTFPAHAQVDPPEYSDQVVWTIDDIGKQPAINPPMSPQGADVIFTYDGLPKNNDDFGNITIHAEVNGQKAEPVTIQVFFMPQETNHPGKGSNETPNWFYYWGQTSAGKGFNPEYKKKSPCTEAAVGTYVYGEDTIFLYSTTYSAVCMNRWDGSVAKKIDCYAETLRHEQEHKEEMHYWWDDFVTSLPTPFIAPAECNYVPSLSNMLRNKFLGYDSDGDLVPDYIEKGLAGCDPNNPKSSCSKMPAHLKGRVPDVDMNSYRISWKKWPLNGSADKEDWSEDGKQWK